MSIEGNVVCLTGASGYIASWLVKLLLDRGYTVHATIMSLDDPKQTQHLLALDGAKERLSLFEANLTAEGSFDSVVNGCVCVFHTASPMEKSDGYKKSSNSSKKWGGGGPGGGPYGSGPCEPPRGLDNVRGIDHNSLPACGSCCGG